jgi:hypothetical protein
MSFLNNLCLSRNFWPHDSRNKPQSWKNLHMSIRTIRDFDWVTTGIWSAEAPFSSPCFGESLEDYRQGIYLARLTLTPRILISMQSEHALSSMMSVINGDLEAVPRPWSLCSLPLVKNVLSLPSELNLQPSNTCSAFVAHLNAKSGLVKFLSHTSDRVSEGVPLQRHVTFSEPSIGNC